MKINKFTLLAGIIACSITSSYSDENTFGGTADNDPLVYITPGTPKPITPQLTNTASDDNTSGNQNTPIPSVRPSSSTRYVFATNALFNGNLLAAANNVTSIPHGAITTGEAAADLLCNEASKTDGAPAGLYKGLLNNSKSVDVNLTYINARNNARIITPGNSLLSFNAKLEANITRIKSEVTPEVWTGFTPLMNSSYSGWGNNYFNGAEQSSCKNWTSSSKQDSGVYGNLKYLGSEDTAPYAPDSDSWSAYRKDNCDKAKALICVQQ